MKHLLFAAAMPFACPLCFVSVGGGCLRELPCAFVRPLHRRKSILCDDGSGSTLPRLNPNEVRSKTALFGLLWRARNLSPSLFVTSSRKTTALLTWQ
jgi:hypothetical protein